MEYGVGIASSYLKPSGLLISTVFYELVLSETVRVTLDKIQYGIVETSGSLKLCEGSDHPCRSEGGKVGPVTLRLESGVNIDESMVWVRAMTYNVDLQNNVAFLRR